MRDDVKASAIETYKRSIRQPVRGLWNGALTFEQAFDSLNSAIERGLRKAWMLGAKDCGIAEGELTPQEIQARDLAIIEEKSHVFDYLEEVEEKSDDTTLVSMLARTDLWINRFTDIRNQAKVLTCKDVKLLWKLGSTSEHCSDCLNYDGRVYRASQWERNNIRPQSRRLQCKGFRCLCQLIPTDKPITKGKIPRPSG